MFQCKKFIYIIIAFLLAGTSAFAQKERSMIRSGNEDYKKRNFSEAETKYRKSLEANPYSFPGNYNLGNALYKQNKTDEAVRFYSGSAAIGKDKKAQSDAYYNLGNANLKAEKYQESINAYKQALKLNENDQDARYNLAYALTKMKQQQQQKQQQQKDKKQDQKKDQKQDQKKNQQQQKDQQKQQQQDQAKQQSQPKISKEDAERMLQALKNEEKNLQKKLAKRFDATTGNPEKDW
jgi:Ca-activated chloride channel family protein